MDFKLQSDEIDKLTAAFVEAKKEFLPFKATAKGNWGAYVSIDDMRAATNDALIKHGVKLTQDQAFSEFNGGTVFLVTKLAHGNQWERSFMPIYIPANPRSIDQAYGSSFSYQRRYALYNLFGIKGEDLDPDSVPVQESKPVKKDVVDTVTLSQLLAAINKRPDGPAVEKSILKRMNITRLDSLTEEQAKSCLNILSK